MRAEGPADGQSIDLDDFFAEDADDPGIADDGGLPKVLVTVDEVAGFCPFDVFQNASKP